MRMDSPNPRAAQASEPCFHALMKDDHLAFIRAVNRFGIAFFLAPPLFSLGFIPAGLSGLFFPHPRGSALKSLRPPRSSVKQNGSGMR